MDGLPVNRRIFWRIVLTQVATIVPLTVAGVVAVGSLFQLSFMVLVALVFCVATAASLASLVAGFTASGQVSVAIDDLGHILRRVAAGDYDTQLPLAQRWLLEPLGESAEQMQENLRRRFSELETSRDQLRTVLDSMVEGVIAVDDSLRIILVNNSACRLFRFHEGAAIGRPVYELIRNPLLLEWINLALAQPEPVGGDLELVVPLPRSLSVRAAGLPARSTPGAVVVVSDVSELRRLEQVRQEFVANASHELKTPLASISACAETLLSGMSDDPEMRDRFLKTIQEQSDRLTLLVLDLLSLTRLESEGLPRDLKPISIPEVVAICQQRHQQHAERKRTTLLIEPADEPLTVLGDEESLEQILDNLLDNALKYTNEQGRVIVRWWREEDLCILEVEDSGIGIPQNQLARIFERFYRVDRARSRELGGTGLGLSIVKHLVQVMGGTIAVTSRLGRGSTFTVRLPLYYDPHSSLPAGQLPEMDHATPEVPATSS